MHDPNVPDAEALDPRVSLFISLRFFPSERLVSAISRLVCDFCDVALADLDAGARFQMAAHELAENITKYATTDQVALEVELLESGDRHVLRIRTRNHASPQKLQEVGKRLEQLRNADDPLALYDRLILETAPVQGTSGLGLARIRAEGDLEFDYSINGDELTVQVQAPVEKCKMSAMPVPQLGIHRVADDNVEMSPSLGDQGILVRFRGEGNSFAVSALRDYLHAVFEEMERLRVTHVGFDVSEMSFINSSGLKQFVSFLYKLKSAQLGARVRFVIDEHKTWQRRTLSALVRMCPEMVELSSGRSAGVSAPGTAASAAARGSQSPPQF